MANYADKVTDAKLAILERDLAEIYKQASDELQEKSNKYFSKYAERYEREYEAYLAGAYTDQQFKLWWYNQVGRGERWNVLKTDMAINMMHANQRAAAMVNDSTPGIYSLNANFTAYEIEQGTGVAFNLVREQTVRALMNGQNFSEFRTLSVNPQRDYKWNTERIQKAILSGVLQGDGARELSKRFLDVMESNKNAAVRNARTAYTSAQNGGRQHTFNSAVDLGIDVRKEWVATNDKRTRDSHIQLDGVVVDNDREFPNGCMYPGDPAGAPEEVYNCRCAMVPFLPKYSKVRSSAMNSGKNTAASYSAWVFEKESALGSPVAIGGVLQPITAFNMGALTQNTSDAMNKMLDNCGNNEVKAFYQVNASKLNVIDTNFKGTAKYSPVMGGIYINETAVANGSDIKYPYQTLFHEFAHNLDDACKKGAKYISVAYRDANGKSLYQHIEQDYANLVAKATNGVKMKKMDAAQAVIKMVQAEVNGQPKAISAVSDVLECQTGIGYPIHYQDGAGVTWGCGHGKTYWTKSLGGRDEIGSKEFFAEACESLVANPESLAAMQKYFPNAMNAVIEILKGAV